MKKKILFLLCAMCGVGLLYAEVPYYLLAHRSDGIRQSYAVSTHPRITVESVGGVPRFVVSGTSGTRLSGISRLSLVRGEAEVVPETPTDVVVEAGETTVTIVWPQSTGVQEYTIVITKGGITIVTLRFNANGQLIGIAFAPGHGGSSLPEAVMTEGGFQFEITGLEADTQYTYQVNAIGANSETLASYNGIFHTAGVPAGIDKSPAEQVQADGKHILNGRLYILRNGTWYDALGNNIR